MLHIDTYIAELLENLKTVFGSRLVYVGLQGSYMRGEEDENSDIDIMAVLDCLSVADMDAYRSIIEKMISYDKSCGFICGREELAHWNPCEICHLLHTTRDYHGNLSDLVPLYTTEDIQNFIRISLDNLYHEICHQYIHASRDKNRAALPGSYKTVFFILQNIYFLRTNIFFSTKDALLTQLTGLDKAVLTEAMNLKNQGDGHTAYDFDEAYSLLFRWCQETIKTI